MIKNIIIFILIVFIITCKNYPEACELNQTGKVKFINYSWVPRTANYFEIVFVDDTMYNGIMLYFERELILGVGSHNFTFTKGNDSTVYSSSVSINQCETSYVYIEELISP